jgi:hypothetical protein
MVYDFEEGKSFPILETDMHIEAPNWTPEGDALIVNGDGCLFWVDLENPELWEIDTGLCIKLNNDHGITPDGETLIFSDHTYGEGSVIWTQSLGDEDADPKRVTSNSPSWWHGVSPDGKTLTYTAVRDGVFGIYTIGTMDRIIPQMVSGFGSILSALALDHRIFGACARMVPTLSK